MKTNPFLHLLIATGFLSFAFAVCCPAQQHTADCWLENRSGYGVSFFGVQPTTADIQQEMRSLAASKNVPIEVIAAICLKESTFLQFSAAANSTGFVIHNLGECRQLFNNTPGVTAPPGLGLMQLTAGTATQFTVGALITDWRYNLASGVDVLNQKYQQAIAGDPACLVNLRQNPASKQILENWYYAIRDYYSADQPDTAYLDKIYGYIAHPDMYLQLQGLFPAAAITKPASVISGFTTTQGFCAELSGNWTSYQCSAYSGPIHVSSTFGGGPGNPAITSLSPSSIAVNQGTTFPIIYTINAPSTRTVILGASLFPPGQTTGRIDDAAHDVKLSIPTGQSMQQRQFTVPPATVPGTYDLVVGLWNDLNKNGAIDAGDQEIVEFKAANAVSVTTGGGCSYSLYPAEFTSTNSGGVSSSFTVSTSSSCHWAAIPDQDWISLNGVGSGNGSATVGFNVAANQTPSARQGMISVQGQTFTITQSGSSGGQNQNVTVANVQNSIPSARPGFTPELFADITSNAAQSVVLGASVYPANTNTAYTDPTHDKVTSLFAGTTQYHRSFTLPADLPTGTYDVQFEVWADSNGNGHVDPDTDLLLGSFRAYGLLTVQPPIGSIYTIITPQGANAAGAMWRVDGGNWAQSGSPINGIGGLAVGNHTVSFEPTPGWITPADQVVPVNSNQTTNVTGTYILEAAVPPATYTPLSPTRVWDTRSGPGPIGQSGPGQTRNIQVTGVGGIPATGVTAVVLNVTAINPSAQTFVTVWPTGEAQPLASNLNIPAGDARPNLVIVKVGAGGQVSIFNNTGNVDFVADVAGWYGGTTNERYTAISPARLWDTRSGPGPVGRIEAGGSRNVSVTGIAGVPATGVTAVVLNVTAASPSARTFITAWPAGEARPLASNLNVPAGDVRPNLVIVKVGASGQVSFFNNAGDIDLIADVAGYFSSTGSSLNSVSPSRIWDTRSGPGPQGRIGAAGSRNVTVTGIGGVPATGVTAVVLNVTGVRPSAARTFITAFPAGEAKPLASNLNVPANDVRANLVIVKVGGNGQVTFYNNSGDTDVVADVAGWYGLPGQ